MKKIIILCLIVFIFPSFASSKSFKEKADELENSYKFEQIGKYEGAISQIKSMIIMVDNLFIIEQVQNGEVSQPKLKKILNRFNKLIKNGRTKSTFIKMYEYMNDQFPENRTTKGSLNIIEVLSNGGDCNDKSPAFYSIFRYYGFKIYAIFGKAIYIGDDPTNQDGLHSWIGVEFDDKFIELDPLWYGPYYEIKRISDFMTWNDVVDIKDEYKVFYNERSKQ